MAIDGLGKSIRQIFQKFRFLAISVDYVDIFLGDLNKLDIWIFLEQKVFMSFAVFNLLP
jgi:hypothetical protein